MLSTSTASTPHRRQSLTHSPPCTDSSSIAMQRKRLPALVAPTPRRRLSMIRDTAIVTHEPDLLASVRELFSCRPETRFREAWELQHTLFSLGYSDGLAPQAEIEAAIEVARTDWTPAEDIA